MQEPFVKRFEKAAMQFVILSKAKEGEVTKENLRSTFRGNLQMSSDHLDDCIRDLVSDGHIREEGNKLKITDDGREDVQKLQNLAVELANVNGRTQGQGQGQGARTQQATPGGGVAGGMGGSQTGGNVGQQGGTPPGRR